jgi:ParB-like chromosome segregation protein Spo0J
MEAKLVKISAIRPNPENPRTIKNSKFYKLVNSIKQFPQMMELRPIVVNSNMVVLGGNMRLKACKEAGMTEVPVVVAENLTPEQQQEFIIKDNVSFGDWDAEMLANEWDLNKLLDWGLGATDLAIKEIEEMRDEEEDDEDCIYPIAPRMSEKHDYVMIVADNEIEYSYLKTFFGLSDQKDYKSTKVGQGRVVTFEEFKKIVDERNS